MNRNNLKTYAPQARRDFIQAVADRATHFGLTAKKIEPMTEQGEVVLIGGRPFPKSVGAKRTKLEARIQKLGFEQTMEAMAYTWFNRLVAIRFMELHGYLEHGFRVLSHPEGHPQPEILEHAQHVDLPGLDQKKVVELKLDGTKEEELYRLLLIAQCNALHKALPFLFESIDDETELLLPDRLLHSDSLIRNLVNEIPEEDWQEVEIIGWLYQFYISDKKDEVIGKVVASEDIPAATQLFTPNWIVKYLVQNTLGRQWLATYPNSPLKGQMKYYIEPAEQTPEVQEQLKASTPTSLDPEELTLLDPACGSGHILVEAYDLFKAIYEERGRRPKDIPALILTKNLFGLEIDDRAAQLAAFALMMKARADDRRIFDSEAKPNIVAFTESRGMDAASIAHAINAPAPTIGEGHISQGDIATLLALFESAKTFGSLVQIPPKLAATLSDIEKRLNDVMRYGDLTHATSHVIEPLLQQAWLLSRVYDLVIENPPYCGSRYMTPQLAVLARAEFKDGSGDLFAAFVLRSLKLIKPNGYMGIVCPFVWMFIATYDAFRRRLLTEGSFQSMVRLEYNAFEPACVPVSTWVYANRQIPQQTVFIDLSDFKGIEVQSPKTLEAIASPEVPYRYEADCSEFLQIPTAAFAYLVSSKFRRNFSWPQKVTDFVEFTGSQNITGKNSKYVRLWWEVCSPSIGEGRRWVLYSKGGGNRKWWGLLEDVVDWSPQARSFYHQNKTSNLLDQRFWYRPGVTYSMLTSKQATFRQLPSGAVYDKGGPAFHPIDIEMTEVLLGLCNSSFADRAFDVLNPTLNLQVQDVKSIPVRLTTSSRIKELVRECVSLARQDWDSCEASVGFQKPAALINATTTVGQSQVSVDSEFTARFARMKELEEENNRLFIEAYGLQDELSPEVPDDQITLYRPDREEDIKRLISYAIGCMMGRYSLDRPGLIYAHSGNQGFNHDQYKTFPADDDGILPLTEFGWFDDDVGHRFEKFLATAWPVEHLDENLQFVADSFSPKKGESPRETIRRYLAGDFFKHHLSMYKKRPIYWLFSSGKHRGFQALVYLHRYNEGTLARMRTEYVIPLLGKMTARINHLTDDLDAPSSKDLRKRLESEKATVTKQLAEVQAFDEKLRHYADKRIKLDLDDGVKVNYGKFGDLLAEVKSVCGTKDED